MSEMKPVQSEAAPAAIGPYSQAIVSDGWVYCSGQIPLDPATMQLVTGDIGQQTDRVLTNLRAVLEAAGASLETVVKTTVFLSDINDFAAMNEVYSRHFAGHRPARSTIQAGALPKLARIEMDCVARLAR